MNISLKLLYLIFILHKQVFCWEPMSLPKFNVDITETSISGVSRGASFAIQLQIAHSSIIRGAGVFAAIPYDCVRHVKTSDDCSSNNTPPILQSIYETNKWSGNLIDDTINMRNHRLYLMAETLDIVVGVQPMRQVYNYFVTQGRYIPEQNVRYEEQPFGHTFPTDFNGCANSHCTESRVPFISYCGYDGAGAVLNHIYGNLNPRVNKSQRTGSLIRFNQSEFITNPNSGLDNTGYVYIPRACFQYSPCRLHIAFHGCAMSYFYIGLQFIENSGYDLWADSNNIIVVFPQTFPDNTFRTIVTNETFVNSISCWDTLGIYDPLYDTKKGLQIKFIKNIIDRISV